MARIRAEGYRPLAHAAASEALLRDSTLWHDMVRPGIGLYGGAVRHLLPGLIPAQTLVTHPVRMARVPAGETVGYGRTFKLERDSLIRRCRSAMGTATRGCWATAPTRWCAACARPSSVGPAWT